MSFIAEESGVTERGRGCLVLTAETPELQGTHSRPPGPHPGRACREASVCPRVPPLPCLPPPGTLLPLYGISPFLCIHLAFSPLVLSAQDRRQGREVAEWPCPGARPSRGTSSEHKGPRASGDTTIGVDVLRKYLSGRCPHCSRSQQHSHDQLHTLFSWPERVPMTSPASPPACRVCQVSAGIHPFSPSQPTPCKSGVGLHPVFHSMLHFCSSCCSGVPAC